MRRLILILGFALLLFSCSSKKSLITENDDVIRIKAEYQGLYSKQPETEKPRNASALRGNVKGIKHIIEKCKDTVFSDDEVVFLFKDRQSNITERIPMEHIELMGPKLGAEYGVNWIEQFNQPLNTSAIREVPYDTVYVSVCEKDTACGCSPLTMDIKLQCPCPDGREKSLTRVFFEMKLGYGLYKDRAPGALLAEGRDEVFGDIAVGYRWGSRKQYNLGLLYSTGVPMHNSLGLLNLEDGVFTDGIRRPLGLVYGKYSFPEKNCIRPYMFGEFGISIDELSMELTRLNLCPDCEDCRRQYDRLGADINTDLPLSYGFGVGVDVPLNCSFDLSMDIGYRSVAFGEKSAFTTFGFRPISNRRLDMFMFRVGITL